MPDTVGVTGVSITDPPQIKALLIHPDARESADHTFGLDLAHVPEFDYSVYIQLPGLVLPDRGPYFGQFGQRQSARLVAHDDCSTIPGSTSVESENPGGKSVVEKIAEIVR